jgi:hypothetical protein
MLPSIVTANDRVRKADLFPRIRDAERSMAAYDAFWGLDKNSKTKRNGSNSSLTLSSRDSPSVNSVSSAFSTFTLKDPNAAAEAALSASSSSSIRVHHPSHDDTQAQLPRQDQLLQGMWMSGYLHHAADGDLAVAEQQSKKVMRESDSISNITTEEVQCWYYECHFHHNICTI